MRLSRNFYLHEFLVSQTATRTGIDMTPPESVVDNLRQLCVKILQPLRDDIVRASTSPVGTDRSS